MNILLPWGSLGYICPQEKVEAMEKNIVEQLEKMEKESTTKKDMEKEVALITQEREDLRKKLETEEV